MSKDVERDEAKVAEWCGECNEGVYSSFGGFYLCKCVTAQLSVKEAECARLEGLLRRCVIDIREYRYNETLMQDVEKELGVG